jgi:hypothetical protein
MPLAVADDRDVRRDVLGDLRRVDVDVDELRARGELGELAGDAVVEARADAADEVGLVHRVVRRAGAVHAEHPEPLRVGAGKPPRPFSVVVTGKRSERQNAVSSSPALAEDDAAARVDDRAPRGRQRLGGLADLLDVALRRGLVAREVDVRDRHVVDVRLGQVRRDVEDDGPGRPVRAMWKASCSARGISSGAGS